MGLMPSGEKMDRLVATAIGWDYDDLIEWHPSTRISQAVKALEVIKCNSYSILRDTDGKFYCSINPSQPSQETVMGETMALAICRTLLSYSGVKVTF